MSTVTTTINTNSSRNHRFLKDKIMNRSPIVGFSNWGELKNSKLHSSLPPSAVIIASVGNHNSKSKSPQPFAVPQKKSGGNNYKYVLPNVPAGISIQPTIVPNNNTAKGKFTNGTTVRSLLTNGSTNGKGDLYSGGMYHLQQRDKISSLLKGSGKAFYKSEDDDGYSTTSSTKSSLEKLPTKSRQQSLMVDKNNEMEGDLLSEDVIYRFESRRKPKYVSGLPMDLEISEVGGDVTDNGVEIVDDQYEEDEEEPPAVAIASYGPSEETDDGPLIIHETDSSDYEMLSVNSPGQIHIPTAIRNKYNIIPNIQPEMEEFTYSREKEPRRGRPKNTNPSLQMANIKAKKYMSEDITDPTVRNAISARRNRERKKQEFAVMKERAEAAEYKISLLEGKLATVEYQYNELLGTTAKVQDYCKRNMETMTKVFDSLAPEAMKKFGKKITAQVTCKDFMGKEKPVKLYYEVEENDDQDNSKQQSKNVFSVDIHRGEESITLHYNGDTKTSTTRFDPKITFFSGSDGVKQEYSN